MDSTTESASTETKTYKEGQLIKGKDFIRLESPLVLLSKNTPLLTEAQDVAGAINELFQSGTVAANVSFRAVLDDNAGLLKIIVQENEKYADYEFAYETFDFSDSITTKTTNGDTTTTTTRTFSKRIVTSLTDNSGAVLLLTEYDTDNGEILGYTDGSGEVVYTSEWRSEYEVTETQGQGASSAAVAWVMARNMEQSESLAQQKKAYRKGVGDYSDKVVTEEWETTDTTLDIIPDGSLPALTDMEQGYTVHYDNGETVRIFIQEYYYENTNPGYVADRRYNKLCTERTDVNGNVTVAEHAIQFVENYYNAEGQISSTVELTDIKFLPTQAVDGLSWTLKITYYNTDGSILSTKITGGTANSGSSGNYVYTTNY